MRSRSGWRGYDEIMHPYSARAAWLILLGVAVLAAAGIAGTLWLNAAPSESVQFSAVSFVWLNFALQICVLAAALIVAFRFLKADRKRRAEQARSEHLAEVALLAGGLAHEVRNHLHALQSRLGLLRKSLSGDNGARQRIEKLDEIADGMEQLLNNYLTLARPATDELEDVNPADLIREVVEFEQLDLDRLGIHVDLAVEESLKLLIDRGKLKRALLNIIVNSRQAMPNGGHLRIGCTRERAGVRISVEDSGDGIPPDVLPRVFESYFTTKSEGSGLGLAIVRRTIEDFGGHVSCNSTIGIGTTISIYLPRQRERSFASSRLTVRAAPVSEGAGT